MKVDEYKIGDTFYAADPEFMEWYEENQYQEMLTAINDSIYDLLRTKGKLGRALTKKIREYYPQLEDYDFATSTSYERPPKVTIKAPRSELEK